MLLFTEYKATWLATISSHCLAALPTNAARCLRSTVTCGKTSDSVTWSERSKIFSDFYHYALMHPLYNFSHQCVGPCKSVSNRAPHLLTPALVPCPKRPRPKSRVPHCEHWIPGSLWCNHNMRAKLWSSQPWLYGSIVTQPWVQPYAGADCWKQKLRLIIKHH